MRQLENRHAVGCRPESIKLFRSFLDCASLCLSVCLSVCVAVDGAATIHKLCEFRWTTRERAPADLLLFYPGVACVLVFVRPPAMRKGRRRLIN